MSGKNPVDDSRERFSNRVDDYQRYRPGYPAALIDHLLEHTGLAAGARIADIGAGTGILTGLLLDAGLAVTAVEPNANMRAAAESLYAANPAFTSSGGGAEDTGLDDASVDLVTAAQAFHWFANRAAVAEFARILRPGGRMALIWNRRQVEEPVQREYDALLRQYAPEYARVNHMNIEDAGLEPFFAEGSLSIARFDNIQQLDFDSLIGRLRSASYCPAETSRQYTGLRDALAELFARYALDGSLQFTYQTRLYLGLPRA